MHTWRGMWLAGLLAGSIGIASAPHAQGITDMQEGEKAKGGGWVKKVLVTR